MSWERWYQQNKEALNARRRQRYSENSEYRQRAIANSQRFRERKRAEILAEIGDRHSLAEAAEQINRSPQTIRFWHNAGYLPSPDLVNGKKFYSPSQVGLLSELAQALVKKGRSKTWHEHRDQVINSIWKRWYVS